MLISDSHRFVFVHVRKTAGSSVRRLLAPYALPTPPGPWRKALSRAGLRRHYHRHVFRAHAPIRTARDLMPADLFRAYFKFAIVRNPWERLVSEYEYLLRIPSHGRHRRVKKLGSFAAFVQFQIARPTSFQWHALSDERGDLLVDRVYRHDRLQDEFPELCRRLGVPIEALPRLNVAPERDWRGYYDAALAATVAEHWRREIEHFEFRFEAAVRAPRTG